MSENDKLYGTLEKGRKKGAEEEMLRESRSEKITARISSE